MILQTVLCKEVFGFGREWLCLKTTWFVFNYYFQWTFKYIVWAVNTWFDLHPWKKVLANIFQTYFHSVRHWVASWKIVDCSILARTFFQGCMSIMSYKSYLNKNSICVFQFIRTSHKELAIRGMPTMLIESVYCRLFPNIDCVPWHLSN